MEPWLDVIPCVKVWHRVEHGHELVVGRDRVGWFHVGMVQTGSKFERTCEMTGLQDGKD